MSRLSHYKKLPQVQRGFTIVELLVTLTIVVLVTGLVMIRYSSFNSSVLLTSQAYITAFDIREAQSLAVSVRGNSNEFREEYGMYFDMSLPNQYQLFQDDNMNGKTDPVHYDNGEAVGAPLKVDSRFSIINICATNNTSRTCYADDPETGSEVIDTTLDEITISFKRPDFDAAFYSPVRTSIQSAEIVFGNENTSLTKKVVVYQSGQISIE